MPIIKKKHYRSLIDLSKEMFFTGIKRISAAKCAPIFY